MSLNKTAQIALLGDDDGAITRFKGSIGRFKSVDKLILMVPLYTDMSQFEPLRDMYEFDRPLEIDHYNYDNILDELLRQVQSLKESGYDVFINVTSSNQVQSFAARVAGTNYSVDSYLFTTKGEKITITGSDDFVNPNLRDIDNKLLKALFKNPDGINKNNIDVDTPRGTLGRKGRESSLRRLDAEGYIDEYSVSIHEGRGRPAVFVKLTDSGRRYCRRNRLD